MTHASPDGPQLVLGSGSPRRAQLLREAGIGFSQRSSPFDEAACDVRGLSVVEQVHRLAEGKADALAAELSAGMVLTADTLLSLDGEPLGKPADAADARRTLERLMGAAHEVVTGVCLVDAATAQPRDSFVDTATVTIAPLDADTLEAYLASNAWRGKAGGYNLAELERTWRFTVDGDPTTVVGLPMRRLLPRLRRWLGLVDAEDGPPLQSPRADHS